MNALKTPDITAAQVIALAQALLGVAAAFGLPISEAQSTALLGLVTVIGSVLFVADAKIRSGRAQMMASKVTDEDLGI